MWPNARHTFLLPAGKKIVFEDLPRVRNELPSGGREVWAGAQQEVQAQEAFAGRRPSNHSLWRQGEQVRLCGGGGWELGVTQQGGVLESYYH